MKKAVMFCVAVVCIALAAGRAQADLVGHWTFDEGSGTVAADSTIYGNHGTLTNMDPSTDWVAGKIGSGLDFDGNNDFVDIGVPASTILDLSDAFTVMAWVKPTGSFHSSWNYVVRHKSKFEFGFYGPGEAEQPRLKVKNDSGTRLEVEGDPLAQGQWYHVAGVRSGSWLGIYVDGVLKDSRNDFAGDLNSNAEFLGIGGEGGDDAFNGTIDDVRIYNHALTQEEIETVAIPVPGSATIGLLGLSSLLAWKVKRGQGKRRDKPAWDKEWE